MAVPDLPTKAFVLYQPLDGNTVPISAEEAASYREEMIDAGVFNLVIYEADLSWTEHGPRGPRPFTPAGAVA